MNVFQKQLVADDGKLFMDKPWLDGMRRSREFYGGSPPYPQKVSVNEFEKAVALAESPATRQEPT